MAAAATKNPCDLLTLCIKFNLIWPRSIRAALTRRPKSRTELIGKDEMNTYPSAKPRQADPPSQRRDRSLVRHILPDLDHARTAIRESRTSSGESPASAQRHRAAIGGRRPGRSPPFPRCRNSLERHLEYALPRSRPRSGHCRPSFRAVGTCHRVWACSSRTPAITENGFGKATQFHRYRPASPCFRSAI